VAAAADQLQPAFQQLGTATLAARYQQIDASSVLPKVSQFNPAYQNLGSALGTA
jgi:hypothetical protein